MQAALHLKSMTSMTTLASHGGHVDGAAAAPMPQAPRPRPGPSAPSGPLSRGPHGSTNGSMGRPPASTPTNVATVAASDTAAALDVGHSNGQGAWRQGLMRRLAGVVHAAAAALGAPVESRPPHHQQQQQRQQQQGGSPALHTAAATAAGDTSHASAGLAWGPGDGAAGSGGGDGSSGGQAGGRGSLAALVSPPVSAQGMRRGGGGEAGDRVTDGEGVGPQGRAPAASQEPAAGSCLTGQSAATCAAILSPAAAGPAAAVNAGTSSGSGIALPTSASMGLAPVVVAGGGGGAAAGSTSGPTHLIVMANGLFGSPSNWSVICEQLREHLDMSTVLLHPSKVNRRTDTYDGIDVCGQRLADEIRRVAAEQPSLQRISVIGHSMGGLLLRYAVGVLYTPTTGLVAGLRPVHFITLATPHLGCDAEGLAQVPFIGWVAMKPVQKVLQGLSIPTAGFMFRRTGLQFFLADGGGAASGDGGAPGRAQARPATPPAAPPTGSPSSGIRDSAARMSGESRGGDQGTAAGAAATAAAAVPPPVAGPLLYRMTQDDPARGLHFYSALASFASRTAYANTDGDHLVGWANSSLRFLHQLPQLPPEAAKARGVVLQDPLLAAFDVRLKPQPEPQSAANAADVPIDFAPGSSRRPSVEAQRVSPSRSRSRSSTAPGSGNGSGSAAFESTSADGTQQAGVHFHRSQSELVSGAAAPHRSGGSLTASDGSGEGGRGHGGGGGESMEQAAAAAMAEVMLRRLQRLPWRRIDVSFRGAVFGLAHNNIQVTRRWLNFEGMAVAHHLARQVVALEAEWVRLEATKEGRSGVQRLPARAAAAVGERQGVPPAPPLEAIANAAGEGSRVAEPLLTASEAAEVLLEAAEAEAEAEVDGKREAGLEKAQQPGAVAMVGQEVAVGGAGKAGGE